MRKTRKMSLSRETLGLLTLTQVTGSLGPYTGTNCYSGNNCTSPCQTSVSVCRPETQCNCTVEC